MLFTMKWKERDMTRTELYIQILVNLILSELLSEIPCKQLKITVDPVHDCVYSETQSEPLVQRSGLDFSFIVGQALKRLNISYFDEDGVNFIVYTKGQKWN